MRPSRLIKVRLEKKPSCPAFQEAKTVSGGEFSAIHRAALYLVAYNFEVKFMLLTSIYMATAKMTTLRLTGAHLRMLKGCLTSLVCTKVNSAIRDPVIIQKINEGERYQIK